MRSKRKLAARAAFWGAIVCCGGLFNMAMAQADGMENSQAHAVLTVAEGKRLIAKAVAQMPVVKRALANGMVIICKGTTNTYVAEELLGKKIASGEFVIGNVTPAKGDAVLTAKNKMPEIVLIKGKHQPGMSLDEALSKLQAGDVIIKGGNMLDYRNKTVGVWIGSPTGGTTGKIVPMVVARKAHLVIPIGLEKQVAGLGTEIVDTINEPVNSITKLPSMWLLRGQIVTEIEALDILADVRTFQASAGGIGGAEGASWLVWRGNGANVRKALSIVEGVQGEPPFAGRD